MPWPAHQIVKSCQLHSQVNARNIPHRLERWIPSGSAQWANACGGGTVRNGGTAIDSGRPQPQAVWRTIDGCPRPASGSCRHAAQAERSRPISQTMGCVAGAEPHCGPALWHGPTLEWHAAIPLMHVSLRDPVAAAGWAIPRGIWRPSSWAKMAMHPCAIAAVVGWGLLSCVAHCDTTAIAVQGAGKRSKKNPASSDYAIPHPRCYTGSWRAGRPGRAPPPPGR